MPRQDIFDNRVLHNLRGIDLRKNADSNSAEDMVNVWVNPEHLFTNRPMPSLYKVGQTTFNGNYKFACECKNLAGSEVEIDISSAESLPVASGVQEATDDTGEVWILGSNLETVREVLWVSEEGGVLVGGTDFSFYYDRKNDRLVIGYLEGKEDLDTSDYDYFVLISPYGQTSTQYVGMIPDYYFGSKDEYRLRTYVSTDGYGVLEVAAKKDDGSYQRIERWVDYATRFSPDAKHYKVHLGNNSLMFNTEYSSRIATFSTSVVGGQRVLTLAYSGGTAGKWGGAVSTGDTVTGEAVSFEGDLYIGTDNRFRFESTGSGVQLGCKNSSDNYNNIMDFTTV